MLEYYGAQPPIELLRQVNDYHGFYDQQKLFWKHVQDVQFIAACGPPGGGRMAVTPRLFRHFNMLWMPQLSQEAALSRAGCPGMPPTVPTCDLGRWRGGSGCITCFAYPSRLRMSPYTVWCLPFQPMGSGGGVASQGASAYWNTPACGARSIFGRPGRSSTSTFGVATRRGCLYFLKRTAISGFSARGTSTDLLFHLLSQPLWNFSSVFAANLKSSSANRFCSSASLDHACASR